MEVKGQRRYLSLAAACLLALAAAAVVWSVSTIEASDQSITTGREPNRGSGLAEQPSLDQTPIAEMATRLLRPPLYDPPVKTPTPEIVKPPSLRPRPTPKLDLTLVGTIINADQSLAIIADASGQFDVKGVGESLEISPEGIVIAQIEAEQVHLNYQGQSAQLQLDRSKAKNKKGGNRNNNRKRSVK